MPFEPNQTLQHYRLTSKIGEGGMGAVWKAVDTNLDREVAIKILPEIFAQDPERLARFEREAKLLATLNHPNIAGIYGLHETDGTHFLAMEFVDGEDLADRMQRAPIPTEQALAIAKQIAEALEAAHEQGVIHRDLKPANVMLGRGQTESLSPKVKVLDFGLAKALESPGPNSGDPSASPTITSLGTVAGAILGTAAYMSPEQARGHDVDRRADVWSFGALLYEMLSGNRPFEGSTISDTLAAVLRAEPEWDRIRNDTPPQVKRLVKRCLIKEPRSRTQSIAEARARIEDAIVNPEEERSETNLPNASPRRFGPILIVAALLVGALATWLLKPSQNETTPAPDLRFEIMLPEGQNFGANYNRVVAIAPDGRTIAFPSQGMMLRSLDSTEIRLIPETQSARSPAFSSDSRQLAFFDSGHIKRASIDGSGVPVIVGPLDQRPMGMHWADDDSIYIGRANHGIWRVPASGGQPELFVELKEGEFAHGPELLPGGEWVMFSVARGVRAWVDGSIEAQSLKTNERRVLVQRGRDARYMKSGFLTYVQDNTLFAVPFDAETLTTTGASQAMETNVHTSAEDETGAAGYDVSDDGMLAFANPAGTGVRTVGLAFLDKNRSEQRLPLGPRRLAAARLSPDEKRVALQVNDLEGTHIWIGAVDREGVQRLTTTGRNTSPVWSHDGLHIYFASVRDGVNDIWRRPADLSAPAEKLLATDGAELPTSVSADGQWLYFSRMSPGNSDLARVALVGEPKVEVLIDTRADELDGRVSADGRFFCFQSNETGRWDIHVMEIATGRRWMISAVEGYRPIWSRDGRRITYMAGSASVYRVEVQTDPDFAADEPILAFDLDGGRGGQEMDISRDGERILVAHNAADENQTETRPRVTIVMNWADKIAERVAGR